MNDDYLAQWQAKLDAQPPPVWATPERSASAVAVYVCVCSVDGVQGLDVVTRALKIGMSNNPNKRMFQAYANPEEVSVTWYPNRTTARLIESALHKAVAHAAVPKEDGAWFIVEGQRGGAGEFFHDTPAIRQTVCEVLDAMRGLQIA